MAARESPCTGNLSWIESSKEFEPGRVYYLPHQSDLTPSLHIDADLSAGDFNHLVILLRLKTNGKEDKQTCDIAIMGFKDCIVNQQKPSDGSECADISKTESVNSDFTLNITAGDLPIFQGQGGVGQSLYVRPRSYGVALEALQSWIRGGECLTLDRESLARLAEMIKHGEDSTITGPEAQVCDISGSMERTDRAEDVNSDGEDYGDAYSDSSSSEDLQNGYAEDDDEYGGGGFGGYYY